jgi:ketosteroid isomerase-like protein
LSFCGPLEDRVAIRELYGTYADAAFRGDRQAWLDCWSQDCLWRTSFGDFAGKAAMGDQWQTIWANLKAMGFFVELGALEVEGDTARARSWCREILLLPDGRVQKVVGRYDDELRREAHAWRFTTRSYQVLINEKP